MQTGLFYNLSIKPDHTASVTTGALQDNKIQTTAGIAAPEWQGTFGGDGWDVAFDGSAPPVLYSTSGGPNTVVAVSNDDGQTWPSTDTPPWPPSDTGGFNLTPLAVRPERFGHYLRKRTAELVAASRRQLADHCRVRCQRPRRRGSDGRQLCRHRRA